MFTGGVAMAQVKPEAVHPGPEGEQRHGKIVSEVFLTRLLSTKVNGAVCTQRTQIKCRVCGTLLAHHPTVRR